MQVEVPIEDDADDDDDEPDLPESARVVLQQAILLTRTDVGDADDAPVIDRFASLDRLRRGGRRDLSENGPFPRADLRGKPR